MALSTTELRAALEAVLFIAGEPVKIETLVEAFSEEGREAVEEQLTEIERRLRESESGFFLEQTAGGYRFATKPELDPYLRKFFSKHGESRLSMAALETLAMIAYRQPITVPEISELRGVNSAGVIRTLLERKMIRIAGRKNVVGSPFLYRTTREFLVHFGLNSVQDLPRLEEFAEILGENMPDEMISMSAAGAEAAEESAPAVDEAEAGTEIAMTESGDDSAVVEQVSTMEEDDRDISADASAESLDGDGPSDAATETEPEEAPAE